VRSNLEYPSVAWNNLTLADSNKLENIQRKFANLCYNRFIQSNCSRNYELMLNYLHLKTLYSRRQHLDALFLVIVFKNKINCCSIMDTVGLHIPAMQIRDFSTFRVKNVSRLSPLTRCVIAANSVCRSLDIFNKKQYLPKRYFFHAFMIPARLFYIFLSWLNFMYTFGTCLHRPLVFVCCFVHCLCGIHCFCCMCPCWLCKRPMAVESARK
jgi:hypothetical protein